jgi:hypothetical protein
MSVQSSSCLFSSLILFDNDNNNDKITNNMDIGSPECLSLFPSFPLSHPCGGSSTAFH